MSLPWSEKTLKASPVAFDEVMILDSEDADPDTNNKRATLVSLPSSGQTNTSSNSGSGEGLAQTKVGVDLPFKSLLGETDKIILTGGTDDVTFTLGDDVVTIDKPNTYDTGLKQSFVASGTTAGININNQIPSTPVAGDIFRSTNTLQYRGSSATRDIVDLSLSQTLTNKIMTASANTFSGFALGTEVTGESSDLTDGSNIALLNAANIFTTSLQSPIFQSSSGSPSDAGIIRLANIDDIGWRDSGNSADLLLSVTTVTSNEFLTFDGDFVAVTATQGTSGQVLSSNGSDENPTFEDATDTVFPVSDEVMVIEGSAVSSKKIRFDVDTKISTSQTRIITPPDANIELVNTSDGTISNSNVNASADIAFSKLESLVSTNILVGSGSAVATSVAMSGDATINNTGVVSVSIASTDLTDSSDLARDSNNLSFFSTTTSLQLAGVISDETGTGALVFATSPTFTSPVLGTPTSGDASNLTNIPMGSASGTLAVANGGTGVTTDTGSGSVVLNISPTLTTPQITSASSINDVNGNELIQFPTAITNPVNEITILNAIAADPVELQATGGDTNVDLKFSGQGTGTVYGVRETFTWPITDETTPPTTGVKYTTESAPYTMTIEDAIGDLTIAGTGVTLFEMDILMEDTVNSNSFSSIFSTLITIDAGEFTSTTATTPPELSTTTWDKGKRLQLDINVVDSGQTARGAKISLLLHATDR